MSTLRLLLRTVYVILLIEMLTSDVYEERLGMTWVDRLISVCWDSGNSAAQEPDMQASVVIVQSRPATLPSVQQSLSVVQAMLGKARPSRAGGIFHCAVSKVYVSVGRSKVSLVMSVLMSPHPTRPRTAIADVVALSERGFMVGILTPPGACRRRSRDRACATPQHRL